MAIVNTGPTSRRATSSCAALRFSRAGIEEAGGTAVDFNTIVVTDGISMGTTGMRASLMSREVIADSAELAVKGHMLDAVLFLVGCDKTIPAAAMAAARLDLPCVILYGGSIMPGHLRDKALTIQDVFEAVGAHSAGSIDDAELLAVEKAACPGAGACGGQFTAIRWRWRMTSSASRPMAQRRARAQSGQAGDRARRGQAVMDALRAGRNARRPDHPRKPAQRRRCGHRDRRLDQPRPPFARDRARAGIAESEFNIDSSTKVARHPVIADLKPASFQMRPTWRRRAGRRCSPQADGGRLYQGHADRPPAARFLLFRRRQGNVGPAGHRRSRRSDQGARRLRHLLRQSRARRLRW